MALIPVCNFRSSNIEKKLYFAEGFCVWHSSCSAQPVKKKEIMEALLRITLVLALCLAGGAAFGQTPTLSKQPQQSGPRKTNPPKKAPAKKINPAATSRPKTVSPAKTVDFAPAK
jgi:hypothetical protein